MVVAEIVAIRESRIRQTAGHLILACEQWLMQTERLRNTRSSIASTTGAPHEYVAIRESRIALRMAAIAFSCSPAVSDCRRAADVVRLPLHRLNRGNGLSEIEGKAARGSSERRREASEFQWSKWDEYAVLGSRRMDCIGRWESDRADREIASQRHRTRAFGKSRG